MLYLHARVKKGDAEKAKRFLLANSLLDRSKQAVHKSLYVYFPVIEAAKAATLPGYMALARIKPIGRDSISYSELVKGKYAHKGYDMLGNIAVINDMESNDAKGLAKCILDSNKGITTVVKKAGAVHGEYRTRNYTYVLGKKTFEATYKENGCTFLFDIRNTFFSARLSYERARVSSCIKPKESVMVMFAGVGPFAIVIAKQHKDSNVVAIELNPNAYEYMLKNIRLNKLNNVVAVKGDVKKEYAQFKNFADHVVMPLPKMSADFLNEAVAVARDSSIIHIYLFVKAGELNESINALLEKLRKLGCMPTLIFLRKVRDYSPTEIEIVADIRIKK